MKEGYTKKLYWGKWTHKATVVLGESDDSKPATKALIKKVRSDLLAHLKTNGQEFKTLETYTYMASTPIPGRRNGWYQPSNYYVLKHTVTLYFKDPDLLSNLLSEPTFGPMVTYVEKPFSDGHLEALEVEKVVVRNSLWFGKFRYAARMKPVARAYHGYSSHGYSSKHVNTVSDDIRDWIAEQLIRECKRVEDEDYKFTESGYYHSNSHYYFAHAQDAMMFRLTFGQHIKQNERIKLMSELKDEPQEETNESE